MNIGVVVMFEGNEREKKKKRKMELNKRGEYALDREREVKEDSTQKPSF